MKGSISYYDKVCHTGLVPDLCRRLLRTFLLSRRCSLRQWSDYAFFLQVDPEQDARIDSLCEHTAGSSLSQHEVPFLAWSHLAARSPYCWLAHEVVGPHVSHWFSVYVLYTLVGRVTSPVGVADVMRA